MKRYRLDYGIICASKKSFRFRREVFVIAGTWEFICLGIMGVFGAGYLIVGLFWLYSSGYLIFKPVSFGQKLGCFIPVWFLWPVFRKFYDK